MRRLRRAGLAGALLALLAALPALAEPRLAALQVRLEDRQVLASFELRDAIDRRFRERLASGLPTGFSFELDLLRDRQRWLDRPLDVQTLEVAATFDALHGEYAVHTRLGGELVASRVVRTPAEVEAAFTRFVEVPVFTLTPELLAEEAGRRLLVRARGDLGARTVLGFVPTRVTTEWLESNKLRIGPP